MKINLAKSAGFCFGVRRALKIALELAKSGSYVEMLGEIVHNEDVIKAIKNAGIKKITSLKKGVNKILLIRAHGCSKDIIQKASNLGYKIADATCPMVKEIHKIAVEMESKNYRIIIIGDKKHAEVHGIAGQLTKKAIIIDPSESIPFAKIRKINKACVVVQSTQNLEKVLKIVALLKKHIKVLKFFNTICSPTRLKQKEIKAMPLKNDLMLIIGSKASANTKRLFEISKSINKRSYWIQSKDDLRQGWLEDTKTVGITSGSSTPDTTSQEVIRYLNKISANLT
ncbi:MAG: 4-hydroxy-3-methylbut-2-enyl diphosphate reductase [Candidatus Omnitrophota bacterium]